MNWKNLIFKNTDTPTVETNTTAEKMDKKGTTPYLNSRRRWNDHTGSILAQRNMWMVFAITSMLTTLAAVGGIIKIANESKFIPYVVEVDKLGQSVAVQPAQRVSTTSPLVIKANVASFINDARLVTPDVKLQRKAIFKLYAMLAQGDPATNKMSEHLNGNEESNPFKRAEKVTASIEILSVIPQTPETWQVDWMETVRDRKGILVEQPFRMKALLTVTTIEPTAETTEAQILQNPLGVYIVDYSWSKTL